MTGAVIGAVILGILTSGFTFLNVDAHDQEIVKGGVIVAAVVTARGGGRGRRSWRSDVVTPAKAGIQQG